jgi:hypothetical protein
MARRLACVIDELLPGTIARPNLDGKPYRCVRWRFGNERESLLGIGRGEARLTLLSGKAGEPDVLFDTHTSDQYTPFIPR